MKQSIKRIRDEILPPQDLVNKNEENRKKKVKIQYRSLECVYLHTSTFKCAINGCIPCFYKIFPCGYFYRSIISTTEGIAKKLPSNQRPEVCPRGSNSSYNGLYHEKMTILTVGDGDFSFSLSLADQFKTIIKDDNNNKKGRLLATSHESLESLQATYLNINENIENLKNHKVKVIHNVDATALQDSKYITKKSLIFDVVIWNFPCVRISKGADGQTNELEENKKLVRNFLNNIKQYLTEGTGEVHITHKTIEPFSWWDIAKDCGYQYVKSVIFDKYNYPGYTNRKVLDKSSFPCNDALTYIFQPNGFISNNIYTNELLLLTETEVMNQLQLAVEKSIN